MVTVKKTKASKTTAPLGKIISGPIETYRIMKQAEETIRRVTKQMGLKIIDEYPDKTVKIIDISSVILTDPVIISALETEIQSKIERLLAGSPASTVKVTKEELSAPEIQKNPELSKIEVAIYNSPIGMFKVINSCEQRVKKIINKLNLQLIEGYPDDKYAKIGIDIGAPSSDVLQAAIDAKLAEKITEYVK